MIGWLRRQWRQPESREGRNEQRKQLAALPNAIAIILTVTAFVGPYVNPDLATSLTVLERAILTALGALAHLIARRAVRDMEDR